MLIYLKRSRSNVDAVAEYDTATKEVKVLKGSIVSSKITYTEKFRGAKKIEEKRAGIIINNKLMEDIVFRSLSTAANFVTGTSTNGLIAWKTEDGNNMRTIVKGDNNVEN